MGSWDVGSFDNDTAVDWSYGLADVDDLGYVDAAFDRVLAIGGGAVPADAGECAIAAAEVVARLLGRWGDEGAYTAATDTWVRAHPRLVPSAATVTKALAALQRVVQAPSELLELWGESEESGAWSDAVAELRARVARP